VSQTTIKSFELGLRQTTVPNRSALEQCFQRKGISFEAASSPVDDARVSAVELEDGSRVSRQARRGK